MSESDAQFGKGKETLQDVALRYASQHGLHPDKVEWEQQGYEWLLRISDAEHSVKVMFSVDEIEFFAVEDAGNKDTKMKIRNAFASLSM